ncbi:hypothetical protein CDAR_590091 [Caerostris darwini]|uniref:Uncharacterized protein n=1 Tax=Caerostris darwini TaxID=1538125 RepID=A0AAV4NND8_9ARAC|nr:hypothetical protein CDAR_590091 [Caerostris darwini]
MSNRKVNFDEIHFVQLESQSSVRVFEISIGRHGLSLVHHITLYGFGLKIVVYLRFQPHTLHIVHILHLLFPGGIQMTMKKALVFSLDIGNEGNHMLLYGQLFLMLGGDHMRDTWVGNMRTAYILLETWYT